MFNNFDFKILSDPDFKEDSVREELIVPLIKALGYSATGDDRIIRSKSLPHPFVSIGSKPQKINIFPDYLFLSEQKPYWILDAKAPTEDITKSKHVEQAYSYAIHPDIRVRLFALCNGKQFALYDVYKRDPILLFDLQDIDRHWDTFNRILNPKIKAKPELVEYDLDFGLYLRKISGHEKEIRFTATSVNSCFIMRHHDDLYSLSSSIDGDRKCLISIDLSAEKYHDLLKLLEPSLRTYVSNALRQMPYYVDTSPRDMQFGFNGRLSNKLESNAEEDYIPFIVEEVFPFMDFESAI